MKIAEVQIEAGVPREKISHALNLRTDRAKLALEIMAVKRKSIKERIEKGASCEDMIRELGLLMPEAKLALEMMAVESESIKEWIEEQESFRSIKRKIDIHTDEAVFALEMRILQHRHIQTLIDAGVSAEEISDALDIHNDEAVLQLEIMVVKHPRTQALIRRKRGIHHNNEIPLQLKIMLFNHPRIQALYHEIRYELGIYTAEARSLLQMKVSETTYYNQSWPDEMDCSFSWLGYKIHLNAGHEYYQFCGPNNKTKFTGRGTRKEFDETVDKWKKSAPKNEDRTEAARRMKASARENSRWLTLSGLPITSLPDISFLRLTSLYLSDTNLATISEKFLPKTLEYINFDNTPIEQLPDTFFSALPSLNKLKAKNCRLENLPKNMKNSLKNKAISIELQGNPLSDQAFEIYKEFDILPALNGEDSYSVQTEA